MAKPGDTQDAHARTERAALAGCRMLLAERLATKADEDDVMSENERLKEELRCLQVGPRHTQRKHRAQHAA